jgi:hypothetical protein
MTSNRACNDSSMIRAPPLLPNHSTNGRYPSIISRQMASVSGKIGFDPYNLLDCFSQVCLQQTAGLVTADLKNTPY